MNDSRPPALELEIIRVSLSRLAIRAGLGDHIPGIEPGTEPTFNELTRVAREHDRGWNALIARLISQVDDRESDYSHKLALYAAELAQGLRST